MFVASIARAAVFPPAPPHTYGVHTLSSPLSRALATLPARSQQGPARWWALLRERAPVATTIVVILFVGLLLTAAIPGLLPKVVLLPFALVQPWAWYRFLTYALVAPSLAHWGLVGGLILMCGWLAERWLDRRTMWIVVAIGTIVSGVLYAFFSPVGPPTIGGGYVAAAFAGAAVASCAVHRRTISRGTLVLAIALLLMYGLAPLKPNPQSLTMFAGFVIAGAYTLRRLKSRPNRALVEIF